jgi:hypothetical protein
MADEKELGPAAITYAEVLKGHNKDGASAGEAWRKIGEITGAGHVPPHELATIQLTDASASVRERVSKLASVEPAKEEAVETEVVIDETKAAAEPAAEVKPPAKKNGGSK